LAERFTRMQLKKSSERATYKVHEAAAIAGCGDRALRKGIRDGIVPSIQLGRNILIPRVAFHRWLDSGGNPHQAGEPQQVALRA